MKHCLSLVLALAFGAALQSATPALAAESYDNCTGFIDTVPATIGTQGVWCLRRNLATELSSGSAIEIKANNVTIDCNGFKIGGLAGGPETQATGIYSRQTLNATVRNCSIRGFSSGIHLNGDGRHLVHSNSLDGIRGEGIYVSGTGSIVRDNTILDTGPEGEGSTWAAAINVSNGVDVVDNFIDGVLLLGSGAEAYGIYNHSSLPSVIQGNRIRNLAGGIDGLGHGIFNAVESFVVVKSNVLHGMGGQSIGISCWNASGVSSGNIVLDFNTPIDGCTSTNDMVGPGP